MSTFCKLLALVLEFVLKKLKVKVIVFFSYDKVLCFFRRRGVVQYRRPHSIIYIGTFPCNKSLCKTCILISPNPTLTTKEGQAYTPKG